MAFNLTAKTKGKTVKTLHIPGAKTKAAKHGPSGPKKFGPKEPPTNGSDPGYKLPLEGSGSDAGGADGEEELEQPVNTKTKGGQAVMSQAGDLDSESVDTDCPCGDPSCDGCIVGAMRSDKAMNSFIGKVKKSYGSK